MEDNKGSEGTPKKESMSVKISPDRMNAFIVFHAPENGGIYMTKEEIGREINSEGVKSGINQEILEQLFEKRSYENLYNIAKGKESVKGEDGRVVYNFQIEKKLKPKERPDGSVDFFDLNLIENAKEGDILASIVPPTDGEDGFNVMGEKIFAMKGKPASPRRGRNVSMTDDGTKLFAVKAGQVGLIDGKVVINDVYELDSDVGTGTGNVNFVGNVTIRGGVLTGFKVFAAGNLEVHGVVEGATIEAKGSITLHSGVFGNGRAEIKAGGDLVAKYLENCTVSVSGNIISEAIMDSNVRCSNTIELQGKKGLILGGSVTAGRSIKAKVIGSVMGTHTELKVGVDPTLIEMYNKNKEEIEHIKAERIKSLQIKELLEAKNKKGLLDEEKKTLLQTIINTNEDMIKRMEELEDAQELLMQKIAEIESGEIKIEQKAYPNVEIYVSSAYMRTKEELARCTLRKEDADIRIGAY